MTALQQGIVRNRTALSIPILTSMDTVVRDVGYYPELTLTGICKNPDTGVSPSGDAGAEINGYLCKSFAWRAYRTGLTGESRSGLVTEIVPLLEDLDRATFAFGYGLMVTLLQLAHALCLRLAALLHLPSVIDHQS